MDIQNVKLKLAENQNLYALSDETALHLEIIEDIDLNYLLLSD